MQNSNIDPQSRIKHQLNAIPTKSQRKAQRSRKVYGTRRAKYQTGKSKARTGVFSRQRSGREKQDSRLKYCLKGAYKHKGKAPGKVVVKKNKGKLKIYTHSNPKLVQVPKRHANFENISRKHNDFLRILSPAQQKTAKLLKNTHQHPMSPMLVQNELPAISPLFSAQCQHETPIVDLKMNIGRGRINGRYVQAQLGVRCQKLHYFAHLFGSLQVRSQEVQYQSTEKYHDIIPFI